MFLGIATRRCVLDSGDQKSGQWSAPDLSQCADKRVVKLMDRVRLRECYELYAKNRSVVLAGFECCEAPSKTSCCENIIGAAKRCGDVVHPRAPKQIC